ncbi:MAG: tRNA adenosine(34) deaminase TadA [Lachnospiraceae bacterium]|nr:tRNA adenosine(34) deaminase TadA [Lachnospiraceae bacterium]
MEVLNETISPEREATEEERKYMKAALKQAEKALTLGEVPIGCVIVCDGRIVGRGYNRRNTNKTTLAHAELVAIDRASRKLGDWRLEGCTLYVTLEPCQMCAGAIVQSRIDRVVVGTMNPKAGCAGSILNILQMSAFNHQVELVTGVLREECTEILQTFFKELRERNRREKLRARQEAEGKMAPGAMTYL